MRSKVRPAFLAFAALLAAAAGRAQLPQGIAHWKSTIEVQGGSGGEGAGPMPAEVWVKGGSLRTQTKVLGMTQDFVRSGNTIYQWTEGQKSGMKMSAAMGARAGVPADYAARISEYRAKGRRTGGESLDGHPCEIYVLTIAETAARSRKETVWLATDLHGFPLQVIAESEGSRITSRNREVSFPSALPDDLFIPPPGVQFRDLSEVMPRSQRH